MFKPLHHHTGKKICRSFSSASQIIEIKAREVLNSRGTPTVEAEVITELGKFRAITPSGDGEGQFEAIDLIDRDQNRYKGKGVLKAVQNINEVIGPALKDKDCTDQFTLDSFMVEELDGSKNNYGWDKKNLGCNAICAVSLALLKAGAAAEKLPVYRYLAEMTGENDDEMIIPVPQFNLISGGKLASSEVSFNQFTVIPIGAQSYRESIQIGVEIYLELTDIIQSKNINYANVGLDGGLTPNFQTNLECLDNIMEAMKVSGHNDGKVMIGINAGASLWYDEQKKQYDMNYKRKSIPSRGDSSDDMVCYYQELCNKYPIASLEDPFHVEDWEGYQNLTKLVGKEIQIAGDDLTSTNSQRIHEAGKKGACNGMVMKVNQIGTVSEAIKAYNLARNLNWGVVLGQRSRDSEDTISSDIAVGLGVGQVKFGAPVRGERTAKHNQVLRIEEELGDRAVFAGEHFREPFRALL